MRRFPIVFFLPMINTLITVKIYRQALFYSNSSCAFIRNNTLLNDDSMQTCIWQCQDAYDCQTSMYDHQKKICVMFGEDCDTGRIVFDGNVQTSVICNQKNDPKSRPMRTCTSTITTVANFTTSTSEGITQPIPSTATIKTRSLMVITRPDDIITGIYNTTAGQSTGGKDGRYTTCAEYPSKAIDNSTSTKYFNFGSDGIVGVKISYPGVGTGFYVTSSISNITTAIALRFATGNDNLDRDPITVTLEGTNSNAISYKSYRLLVTSQRNLSDGIQYSEIEIIGYI